jgi:hypothetical protein
MAVRRWRTDGLCLSITSSDAHRQQPPHLDAQGAQGAQEAHDLSNAVVGWRGGEDPLSTT